MQTNSLIGGEGFAAGIFCAFFTQAVLVAGGHMAKACLQGVTGDDVRCSGVAGLQQLVLGSGV